MSICIVADIGRTSVKVALDKWGIQTNTSENSKNIVYDIANFIIEKILCKK